MSSPKAAAETKQSGAAKDNPDAAGQFDTAGTFEPAELGENGLLGRGTSNQFGTRHDVRDRSALNREARRLFGLTRTADPHAGVVPRNVNGGISGSREYTT